MLIIGEKINSTRDKVREMIENRDSQAIQELAVKQIEAGAHVLDVNSSAASGNKEENIKWLVKTVQEKVSFPLCIDSANHLEIEMGLSVYRDVAAGKAFINSITGEKEGIERLLPIIKKYQCRVAALVMDERGIPEDARTRITIAKRLIEVLVDAGTILSDIYIDPLVVPIGTSDDNGVIVLDTIRGIKEDYPEVKTIIGLSNISYGLPERRLLNQVFMILAMSFGLDAAIIDPTDRRMMAFIKTASTLLGQDSFCIEYIKAYREGGLTF